MCCGLRTPAKSAHGKTRAPAVESAAQNACHRLRSPRSRNTAAARQTPTCRIKTHAASASPKRNPVRASLRLLALAMTSTAISSHRTYSGSDWIEPPPRPHDQLTARARPRMNAGPGAKIVRNQRQDRRIAVTVQMTDKA